jgi:hypothetical protein
MTRTFDLDQAKLQENCEAELTLDKVNWGKAESRRRSLLGSHPGWVTYIADDFDAELPDSFWLGEE